MLRRNIIFGIGLALGLLGVTVLFADPAGRVWLVPFLLSGTLTARPRPGQESLRDVSSIAVTAALLAVAVVFGLLLVPEAVWTAIESRVPAWVYRRAEGNAVPMAVQVGLAAVWSVVMWRRIQQLRQSEPARTAG